MIDSLKHGGDTGVQFRYWGSWSSTAPHASERRATWAPGPQVLLPGCYESRPCRCPSRGEADQDQVIEVTACKHLNLCLSTVRVECLRSLHRSSFSGWSNWKATLFLSVGITANYCMQGHCAWAQSWNGCFPGRHPLGDVQRYCRGSSYWWKRCQGLRAAGNGARRFSGLPTF